eukprot:GGOE01000380.1.p1 GENE.GGOE01000380.1~~GGOE01000380.1.p1  ORF type:complete len:283 (-),score=67.23 GGOE01000380.1:199-1047(-)
MLKFTHEYYRHVQRRHRESKQAPLFHRDRCFLAISINGREVGAIEVQLYSAELPRTCENFRALCTGEKGQGRIWKKPLHYKGCAIHRVLPRFIIQGGDFSHGNGSGGESVYGEAFEDEGFLHRHTRPGLLSMANTGPNTNSSQFFITLAPAPHLDGLHVIFGEVVQGMEIVRLIEQIETSDSGRPKMPVKISNCGMVPVAAAGEPVGEADNPEDLLKRREEAQVEDAERLVTNVTASVQAALQRARGRTDDTGDAVGDAPASKKQKLLSRMLRAVDDVSDSE